MKGDLGDDIRLKHIQDCILDIESAIKGNTFESFNENNVLKIAVVKWLEIIGEAARDITEETKEKGKDIEWRNIIGLRNIVVHEYLVSTTGLFGKLQPSFCLT